MVTGKEVYPHRRDLHEKNFWMCFSCDAYVGCHTANERYAHDGTEPLGTLANPALRRLRHQVHTVLDPRWKTGGMKRHEAYGWLAEQLGIDRRACHIAMFREDACRRAIEVCE